MCGGGEKMLALWDFILVKLSTVTLILRPLPVYYWKIWDKLKTRK